MSRQHVEYTTSVTPGDDLDTGEKVSNAIKPLLDGEPAQEAVMQRPTENLRTRTEVIRDELEKLKYMSEADRAFVLTSTGSLTWYGVGGVLPQGTFTSSQPLTLKPFLAPNSSTASRLIICANTTAQVTIRTRQNGVAGQPRAYSGANDISFDFQPVDTGTGAVVVTVDGSPANNFHVQFDSNAVTGTTVNQLITALNLDVNFVAAGLEAVVEGGGSPAEVGYPAPPTPVLTEKIITHIVQPGETDTRFMAGAADAEKHIITSGQLVSFFGDSLNLLQEGDVLCIRYDDHVMALDGGRRQSLNELPENKALSAGNNLFLLRRFPERLPGALPLATVQNDQLIFINGRTYAPNDAGPIVGGGGGHYQGSGTWAGGIAGIPAGTFESAIDTIVAHLADATGTSGALKIGTDATTNIAAGNVQLALATLDTAKAGLNLQNFFLKTNIFATDVTNGTSVVAQGDGTGYAVQGTGGAGSDAGILGIGSLVGAGVKGQGGTASGTGLVGLGGATDGAGVEGVGAGAGAGVMGSSVGTGNGVEGTGGGSGAGGHGVLGQTVNVGPWTWPGGAAGVVGLAGDVTGAYGHGVVGVGFSGAGGSGVVGLGDTATVAPVPGNGAGVIGAGGFVAGAPGVHAFGSGDAGGGPGLIAQGTVDYSGVVGNGRGHGVEGNAGLGGTGVLAGVMGRANGAVGYPAASAYAEKSGVMGLGADGGAGVAGEGGPTNGTGGYFAGGGAAGFGVRGIAAAGGVGVEGVGQNGAGVNARSDANVGLTASGGSLTFVAFSAIDATGGTSGNSSEGAHAILATGGQGDSAQGSGVYGRGGDTGFAASGAAGLLGFGGNGASARGPGVQGIGKLPSGHTGFHGVGVYGLGGDGQVGVKGDGGTDASGLTGNGNGTGAGAALTGGATIPTDFATRGSGAGAVGTGGAAGAHGIVARGGAGTSIGVGAGLVANTGVVGVGSGNIGTGYGAGVYGVSAAAAGAVGVIGEGTAGFNTTGVTGIGKEAAPGGDFTSGTGTPYAIVLRGSGAQKPEIQYVAGPTRRKVVDASAFFASGSDAFTAGDTKEVATASTTKVPGNGNPDAIFSPYYTPGNAGPGDVWATASVPLPAGAIVTGMRVFSRNLNANAADFQVTVWRVGYATGTYGVQSDIISNAGAFHTVVQEGSSHGWDTVPIDVAEATRTLGNEDHLRIKIGFVTSADSGGIYVYRTVIEYVMPTEAPTM